MAHEGHPLRGEEASQPVLHQRRLPFAIHGDFCCRGSAPPRPASSWRSGGEQASPCGRQLNDEEEKGTSRGPASLLQSSRGRAHPKRSHEGASGIHGWCVCWSLEA